MSPVLHAISSEKMPKIATHPIRTGLRPRRSPNTPARIDPTSMLTAPSVTIVVNCGALTCHASISDGVANPKDDTSYPSRHSTRKHSALTRRAALSAGSKSAGTAPSRLWFMLDQAQLAWVRRL